MLQNEQGKSSARELSSPSLVNGRGARQKQAGSGGLPPPCSLPSSSLDAPSVNKLEKELNSVHPHRSPCCPSMQLLYLPPLKHTWQRHSCLCSLDKEEDYFESTVQVTVCEALWLKFGSWKRCSLWIKALMFIEQSGVAITPSFSFCLMFCEKSFHIGHHICWHRYVGDVDANIGRALTYMHTGLSSGGLSTVMPVRSVYSTCQRESEASHLEAWTPQLKHTCGITGICVVYTITYTHWIV